MRRADVSTSRTRRLELTASPHPQRGQAIGKSAYLGKDHLALRPCRKPACGIQEAIGAVLFGLSVHAAGIQLLNSDPGLSGAIWYPCAGQPKDVPLGELAAPPEIKLTGVKDCPVTGAKLPLVIFSHGRSGWFTMHHDTVEELADAGFIVAAINHPGDNSKDSSQRNSPSIPASRPADMVRLLDFMLNDWKDRAVINRTRVGFFGFSRGGYTGLVVGGRQSRFSQNGVLLHGH